MRQSSQALLDLEKISPSSKDSTLLVCESDDLFQFKSTTDSTNPPPQTKPIISSVPKSQVLGKLKDFLGVISESNKKLQLDAMGKSNDYNIEVLSGDESEYIEMDLMLGVADLHTPEAVAAAESAIAGNQQVIPLAESSSSGEESDDPDSDIEKMDVDKNNCSPTKVLKKGKRPKKIIELS